jgi:hypothetical protein
MHILSQLLVAVAVLVRTVVGSHFCSQVCVPLSTFAHSANGHAGYVCHDVDGRIERYL